jgi:predicted signal transduction protein with EAL and GGDEF domain
VTLIIPQLKLPVALEDEEQRLEELYSMRLLDDSSDERFDYYTELLVSMLNVSMAAIVLVDKDALRYKSVRGIPARDALRHSSFANHALLEDELFVVSDAQADPRFDGLPCVSAEPRVRFYAAGVIHGPSGRALGVVCVMDRVPRQLLDEQRRNLLQLTRLVEHEMRTRAVVNELRDRIAQHALHDPISGLPNHQLFVSQLDERLAMDSGQPLVLALVRLDRFEQAHKAFGKAGVDCLIAEAVERLKQATGAACSMGQIREDTIAAAFPVDVHKDRDAVIAPLLQSFRLPVVLGEHRFVARVRIGAAIYPEDGGDTATLLKRARTALYHDSASATSGYRFYNRDLSAVAARRFEIESALKEALERDELEVAYQPEIRAKDRRLVGAEALLRWTNTKLGAVSPTEFMPIAEESGLSIEIGAWILDRACRQIAEWHKAGYGFPEISVNISSHQLRLPGFYELVRNVLEESGLAGRWLNLEITEGSLIEDIDQAIRIMEQLRELGVQFSIDDFGTGFSSLSYLRRMPVQALKIDRSFVRDVSGRSANAMLVDSIIAMGHALRLQVVAEGVETEAQLRYLSSAGCDLVQGFLFSPPLPAGDFAGRFLGRIGLRTLTRPELNASRRAPGPTPSTPLPR